MSSCLHKLRAVNISLQPGSQYHIIERDRNTLALSSVFIADLCDPLCGYRIVNCALVPFPHRVDAMSSDRTTRDFLGHEMALVLVGGVGGVSRVYWIENSP